MRLAIIGTGLIGASAGLAARRAEVGEVVGWDEDPNALDVAVEREAVTRTESLPEALEGADVALVAIPVAGLPAVVRSVLDVATDGVHGDGCRIHQGRRLRGGRKRPALRRRASDLRSRDARAGTSDGRPLRRRDVVPHARELGGAGALPHRARPGLGSRRAARSRSSPTRTTGSSPSRVTCRMRSPTCSSITPAPRASRAMTRSRRPEGRCAT